jgi:hypothetical protein
VTGVPPIPKAARLAGVAAVVFLLGTLVGALLLGADRDPVGGDASAGSRSAATPVATGTPPSRIDPSGMPSSRLPEASAHPTTDGGGDDEPDRKPVNESGWERTAVAGTSLLPSTRAVSCPPATTTVTTAESLAAALAAARPGDVIGLADGTYRGAFVASVSGSAQRPIYLCGGRGAVLENEGPKSGYVVHLKQATHWRLVGFSVRQGQKGVMADGTVGSVIQGLTVTDIGDEAIHLRSFSTDNVVSGNVISRTGLRREKFGEGVYIGTAVSNWCTISNCRPDRSDRNVVVGNRIEGTTAEAVDIKEGTTGGLVRDNDFDGSALSGADSWVDVKGTAWLIQGNTGTHSPGDGFQTHEILEGWGARNQFRGNRATVNGPGHGFALTPVAGNTVACDNSATGAAKGLANVPCG